MVHIDIDFRNKIPSSQIKFYKPKFPTVKKSLLLVNVEEETIIGLDYDE